MITLRVADIKADALTIMTGARDCIRRHKAHEGDLNIGSLFPDDDEVLVKAIGRLLSFPDLEILLAEHEGHVVGGTGVLYMPYMWNPDLLMGDKIFWWTEEDAPFRTAMILADETMNRIEARNAVPIFRVLKTDPKGVERLYQKMSMTPVETVYMRLP